MNTLLLLKVKAHILEEPRRFCMYAWITTPDEISDELGYEWKSPECCTVACIGGWACLLSEYEPINTYTSAAILLGLTMGEGSEASRLFFPEEWPDDFRYAYEEAQSSQNYSAMAQIAADRIDHFVATKGRE